jgi:hypothetical protein
MIEPLKTDLVRLLLDGIRYDRLGGSTGTGNTGGTHFQTDATLKGVISSFVEVEEYKKKGNLEVTRKVYASDRVTFLRDLRLPMKIHKTVIFYECKCTPLKFTALIANIYSRKSQKKL